MRNRLKIISAVALSYFAATEAFVLTTTRRPVSARAFARPVVSTDSSAATLRAVSTPVQETSNELIEKESTQSIGNVVFLLPSQDAETIQTKFGTKSPVDCPSVLDAASHICKKASWFSDGTVEATIVNIPNDSQDVEVTKARLMDADALIAFGLSSDSDLDFASDVFDARRKRDSALKSRQRAFE